jgi:hypothetical protein
VTLTRIDLHGQAGRPESDYSVVLYLNTSELHYSGGQFRFLDVDADRIVMPVEGRMLVSPSPVNSAGVACTSFARGFLFLQLA